MSGCVFMGVGVGRRARGFAIGPKKFYILRKRYEFFFGPLIPSAAKIAHDKGGWGRVGVG
jgi:hypothetical protein